MTNKRKYDCLDDTERNSSGSNVIEGAQKTRKIDALDKIDTLNVNGNVEQLTDPSLEREKTNEHNSMFENYGLFSKINITCETCNDSLEGLTNFQQHKPVDYEKPCRFTCKSCPKLFSKPDEYLRHTVHHLQSNTLSRYSTTRDVQNNINLNQFYQKVNESINNKINSSEELGRRNKENEAPILKKINVRCYTCNLLFIDVEDLIEHTSANNDESCSFKCSSCPKNFPESIRFANHLYEHSIIVSSIRGRVNIEQLKCSICHELYVNQYLLMRHEAKHASIKKSLKSNVKVENMKENSFSAEEHESSNKEEEYVGASTSEKVTEAAKKVEKESFVCTVRIFEEATYIPDTENCINFDDQEDGYKEISCVSREIANNDNLLFRPIIFTCTICKMEVFNKSSALDHLRIHNFASCACPMCEEQMEILEQLCE